MNHKRTKPISLGVCILLLILIELSSFYGENRKLLKVLHTIMDRSNASSQTHYSYDGAGYESDHRHATVNKNTLITYNNSDDDEAAPNQHAILMIHYHKTGFVLSRQLRTHAIKNFDHWISLGMTSRLNFTMPIDKPWGSMQQPRTFSSSSHCPNQYDLQRGVINVQESPDLYCHVEELANILHGNETIGTKILHFVRNPYSMAVSNYYYHAQVPTPEPWVKNHNPCKLEYFNNTTTLRDVLFPTLSDHSILSKESFDDVVQLCNSLYQTKPNLENKRFERHLHQLDPIDGLKLSTAQMIIRGGGVMLMAGGDLLRMANNIIKLNQLEDFLAKNETSHPPLTVKSLSMDDFIINPLQFSSSYLNTLTGGDTAQFFQDKPIKGRSVMKAIANRFARNYNETKNKENHTHVTTGKHRDRQKLIESLKSDEVLGPILDAIEKLVDGVLQ